ncbi:MAG: hypothetical protein ABI852_06490 [Gemmatimonadaceae bacterium]
MTRLRPPVAAHGWQDVVAVFAGSFALLALIAIPIYHLEVSRYNRLLRGVDVIARWFVSPGDWKQFVHDEPARNSAPGANSNIVDLNPPMSAEGVEVVIGKNSLIVGGDFHSLPRAGISRTTGPSWVGGYPPSLEFQVSAPNTTETTSEWTLRFPVAANAHSAAIEVQSYYLNRSPELYVERDPQRMRRIGLAMATGGAVALVAGLLAWGREINPTLLLVLVIGGVLVTPGGLLIAFVWHRRMPKRYKKYPY